MAKKTNASDQQQKNAPKAPAYEGRETFDLVSGETRNPLKDAYEENLRLKQEDEIFRNTMKELVWHDELKLLFGQKIKERPNLTYESLTNLTKDMSYFMILQGYSHIDPVRANALNVSGINKVHATDFLRTFIGRTYAKVQPWEWMKKFYPVSSKVTKTVKYTDVKGEEKERSVSTENYLAFCKKENLGTRDYQVYVDLFGEEVMDEYIARYADYSDMKPSDFFKKIKKSESPDYDEVGVRHTSDSQESQIQQEPQITHPVTKKRNPPKPPTYIPGGQDPLLEEKRRMKKEEAEKAKMEKERQKQEKERQKQEKQNPSQKKRHPKSENLLFPNYDSDNEEYDETEQTQETGKKNKIYDMMEFFSRPLSELKGNSPLIEKVQKAGPSVVPSNAPDPASQSEFQKSINLDDGSMVMFVPTALNQMENLID